jgi:hypothetical protein
MTTIEQLVGQFTDDWNAGRRPDVMAFLEHAAPQDRDALASQLETWLDLAPTPAYDEPTPQSIASEPALLTALDAAAALRAPLAERLPTLRDRAGLAIREVAARLTQLFDLDDELRTVALRAPAPQAPSEPVPTVHPARYPGLRATRSGSPHRSTLTVQPRLRFPSSASVLDRHVLKPPEHLLSSALRPISTKENLMTCDGGPPADRGVEGFPPTPTSTG